MSVYCVVRHRTRVANYPPGGWAVGHNYSEIPSINLENKERSPAAGKPAAIIKRVCKHEAEYVVQSATPKCIWLDGPRHGDRVNAGIYRP